MTGDTTPHSFASTPCLSHAYRMPRPAVSSSLHKCSGGAVNLEKVQQNLRTQTTTRPPPCRFSSLAAPSHISDLGCFDLSHARGTGFVSRTVAFPTTGTTDEPEWPGFSLHPLVKRHLSWQD